jgi:protein translocase SecG subunit
MSILVVLFHLTACIALIAIVLLQTGKGAEMGAAFGGASQTLFGGTGGSSFMSNIFATLLYVQARVPGGPVRYDRGSDRTAPGATSCAADAGSS